MVRAERAGEDLAKQIIVTSNLFYQRGTQLRFLKAIKRVIDDEIESYKDKEAIGIKEVK